MEQKIYCDCFYCEYFENGRCISSELHLGFRDVCREFSISEEKMNNHLEEQKKKEKKNLEYGKVVLKSEVYLIRQENEKIREE